MHEFQLIEHFFKPLQCQQPALLAIGDDAALMSAANTQSAHCLDTLVAGRHFLPDADPFDIAWKAVATNVSDLMAMGARANTYLLGLTLPAADTHWLARFSEGLAAVQQAYGVCLLGGDTTRGDQVVVSVSMQGEMVAQAPWLRSGAQVGDGVYLTGPVGCAALGLKAILGEAEGGVPSPCIEAQLRPQLPVETWQRLLALPVHSAIDISDGLAQDAAHIAAASKVQLSMVLERLPLDPAVQAWCEQHGDYTLPLAGGEDYQLLFTAPQSAMQALVTEGVVFEVGEVREGQGVEVTQNGCPMRVPQGGFQHF